MKLNRRRTINNLSTHIRFATIIVAFANAYVRKREVFSLNEEGIIEFSNQFVIRMDY
jgi:hypothetical protein